MLLVTDIQFETQHYNYRSKNVERTLLLGKRQQMKIDQIQQNITVQCEKHYRFDWKKIPCRVCLRISIRRPNFDGDMVRKGIKKWKIILSRF